MEGTAIVFIRGGIGGSDRERVDFILSWIGGTYLAPAPDVEPFVSTETERLLGTVTADPGFSSIRWSLHIARLTSFPSLLFFHHRRNFAECHP
jgi:hypothetical protein